MSARDRAVVLLARLLDRFTPTSEWRHTDIGEVVDALIDAARAPESAHSRALADENPGRRGLPQQGAADDGDR
jgi:hypothetical protein